MYTFTIQQKSYILNSGKLFTLDNLQ